MKNDHHDMSLGNQINQHPNGWEIKGLDHDEQIYAWLNNALQKRS